MQLGRNVVAFSSQRYPCLKNYKKITMAPVHQMDTLFVIVFGQFINCQQKKTIDQAFLSRKSAFCH